MEFLAGIFLAETPVFSDWTFCLVIYSYYFVLEYAINAKNSGFLLWLIFLLIFITKEEYGFL
jgi:hypothetical protein